MCQCAHVCVRVWGQHHLLCPLCTFTPDPDTPPLGEGGEAERAASCWGHRCGRRPASWTGSAWRLPPTSACVGSVSGPPPPSPTVSCLETKTPTRRLSGILCSNKPWALGPLCHQQSICPSPTRVNTNLGGRQAERVHCCLLRTEAVLLRLLVILNLRVCERAW